MSEWVDLSDVALHAQVTPQRLRFIATHPRTSAAARWHGVVVRQVPGPYGGGQSGLRYEFYVPSLPADIQASLKALLSASEPPPTRRDDRSVVGHWRRQIIGPALALPPRSPERADAVREIARTTRIGPDGQPISVTSRTIERWIAAYAADGIAGLMPRAHHDKGERRVVLSDRWDGAVPFDQAAKEDIAHALRAYVRGLHKEGTSAKVIGMLAANKLRELTAARCDYAAAMPDLTFKVPRLFIDQERAFRNVAIFKKDRKAYEDAKPRIFRTREGLAPMQIVVGDVHHLDIVMRRPDGTEAWPKAIAWLDLATNRIWLDVVLLGKGEGIRNADVIASFVRMVQGWGMPRTLYLDNGSEYRWSEFIDDALKLVERIDGGGDDRDSRIVRARPYNAPAKAIEGIFRVLEYTYFCHLPGWAGGDRTNKKTAKVGQPTEPFAGTLDELRVLIGNCLALYESKPQRGALANRSPRAVYEAAVAAGWQRVTIDARELRTVFATSEVRRVRRGAIEYGGQAWTCDALARGPLDTVTIRVPKFEAPAVLPVLDKADKLIGFAEPVTRYPILDKAGAQEASRISHLRRQGGPGSRPERAEHRRAGGNHTHRRGLAAARRSTRRRHDQHLEPAPRDRGRPRRNTHGPCRSAAGKDPQSPAAAERRAGQDHASPEQEQAMTAIPFVETSVSRDIFKAIDLARDFHKCAAIVGCPGGGKSRALRAYIDRIIAGTPGYPNRPFAHLMTVTAVTGNALRDLFRELAEAMGFYVSGSIADMQRQMMRYDLSEHVLIIDEAQNLKLQAYREVLHLFDSAGLVIVFCGNEEVLRRVSTSKGAFAQISRRVPIRIEVNCILDDDADRIANAFGVEGMDAYRLMRQIGAVYHVDGIVSVLEIARRLAGDGTIQTCHIHSVCNAFPHFRQAIGRHAAA